MELKEFSSSGNSNRVTVTREFYQFEFR